MLRKGLDWWASKTDMPVRVLLLIIEEFLGEVRTPCSKASARINVGSFKG